jgi:hypothetical protein
MIGGLMHVGDEDEDKDKDKDFVEGGPIKRA